MKNDRLVAGYFIQSVLRLPNGAGFGLEFISQLSTVREDADPLTLARILWFVAKNDCADREKSHDGNPNPFQFISHFSSD